MSEKFELPKLPDLPFAKKKGSNPKSDLSIESLLPAPPPNLPLPKFLVEQMKKK